MRLTIRSPRIQDRFRRHESRESPALRTEDVSVSFGGVQAVRDVSVGFSSGEITGVIGPNGAGKSTLVAALAGEVAPSHGRIYLGGREVTRAPPYVRARLGLARTFQSTSEFSGLTVFENLLVAGMGSRGGSFWRGLLRGAGGEAERKASQRAWQVLERFDMVPFANSYGRELSGGQRRLVEVMRCLMQDPRVILLDEPMVGVAGHLVERLLEELRRIAAEGVGLIVVEHTLEVVQRLCDRVVVMALGEVIADGSYEEVVHDRAVQTAYLS